MKTEIDRFIKLLYEEGKGGFKYNPKGVVTLLSTCFGVQLCYLIDQLSLMDSNRVANFILEQQLDNGIYLDNQFKSTQLIGRQSEEYIKWQFTYFSLIALDMLGVRPKKPLKFLNKFIERKNLIEWLDKRNWIDFWYSSNEIMFFLYFLTYENQTQKPSDRRENAIEYIFKYLDSEQDSMTGYWGKMVRLNPINGMYGAAHIYLFYKYYGKKVNYIDQILSSTLALQLPDGLYGPNGGGGCEDYDAIEILARLFNESPKQQGEIKASFSLTYETIKQRRDKLGGFSYRLPDSSLIACVRKLINQFLGRSKYLYSGWSKMEADMYQPDIWATYFRLLTLASVEITLGLSYSFHYRSYPLPGWGHLVPTTNVSY